MNINNTSARVIVASLATAALLTACGTNSGTEDSNALALADVGHRPPLPVALSGAALDCCVLCGGYPDFRTARGPECCCDP